MIEGLKDFLYYTLRLPHWMIWPVKPGDDIFFDGCGHGKCINWWDREYVMCHFEYMDMWVVLHKSGVYYMFPEGDPKI